MPSDIAWDRYGQVPLGWSRVQAVRDFVDDHVQFGCVHSRPARTAVETLNDGLVVCRDHTHLAIALSRALNIPDRYCTGYVSDIAQPPPNAPMDFAAWMEGSLGGQWRVFDPRTDGIRFGRVLIARGRAAADVPLTHSFGKQELKGFDVWIDKLGDALDAPTPPSPFS